MFTKKRFFIYWTLFFIGVSILSSIILLAVLLFFYLPKNLLPQLSWSSFFSFSWGLFLQFSWLLPFLLLILILILIQRIWKSRLVVLPEWTVVAEWCGEKMKPFSNGYHYPFRMFDFFHVVAEVPMNKQTLYILSGIRDNLSPELIKQYVYGTASNMEPGTGDFVRLLYRVEVKCIDPLALVYSVNNPYDYVASVVEQKVSLYVHRNKSEDIIDHFAEQTLDTIFAISSRNPDDIRNQILIDTGLKLISFIPVDVINTPEVEAMREQLEKEQRQEAIIKVQIENETKREEGKKKVLTAKLDNMSVQEAIGQKNNDILVNKINAIKSNAGVDGDEALKFIAKEKTLETLEKSSETGNVTYIDDSGSKGNLNQAAALGFAISTTKK